jgi:hypothetical protein
MLCNGVTLRHLLRFTTEQAAVDIRPFGGARRWRYPTLTHPYWGALGASQFQTRLRKPRKLGEEIASSWKETRPAGLSGGADDSRAQLSPVQVSTAQDCFEILRAIEGQ